MKRFTQILLFLLSFSVALHLIAAESTYRTWESAAGSSIEARLLGSPSDDSITLEKEDGTQFVLRPAQLSAGDQYYLEQLAAMENVPQRILFIGNSYTGGISGMLRKLVAASPYAKCRLEFISPGGKTLKLHLEDEATMNKIREGNWDIVVLQDQSQTPAIFPGAFQKAARGIARIIDDSGAKTVFFETWGRRDGDKRNAHLFPNYQKMQKALSKSYKNAARSCKAELAPVGQVWAELRKADPELGLKLYTADGSHPAGPGAYLAACVFYATLFDADPATVDFHSGLTEEQVRAIHEALRRVIE